MFSLPGIRQLVVLTMLGFAILEILSFRSRQNERPVQERVAPSVLHDRFTVLMATYRRPHLLRKSLTRLVLNPYVDRVIVIWQDASSPPPAWLTAVASNEAGKLHIRRSPVNSMNERFRPDARIRTAAVFMLDDDLEIQQDDINAAFHVWRGWGVHGIVGFTPRSHAVQEQTAAAMTNWKFVLRPSEDYSMILTNAAFFDRAFLDAYWADRLAPARNHVDIVFNCDDILFNFLVAEMTSRPPLLVQPRVPVRTRFHSADGLWQRPSHFADRAACLMIFSDIFGYMPLKHTSLSASRDVQDNSEALPDLETHGSKSAFEARLATEEAQDDGDDEFEPDDLVPADADEEEEDAPSDSEDGHTGGEL